MSTLPFPIDPELTAVAVMYRNPAMIADEVLPRIVVAREEFKWNKWALADGFTVPDTLVGRKSTPNQIEFGYTEQTDKTVDFGLDDIIPNSDVQNAPAGYSPLASAVSFITQIIALGREVRAAEAVFGASNYGSSNKATLSGTSQWSHASSNPVSAILTAMDAMVMRPNILVLGQATWTALRQNTKVLEAIKSTGGSISAGVVTRQQVADLFELEAIYVGQSFVNGAKKGQTASLSRAWGKHAALMYRDRVAAQAGQVTFGFTAQFGQRVAGQMPEPTVGLRGSTRVRAGESVKEVITANDLGYLFVDAVA